MAKSSTSASAVRDRLRAVVPKLMDLTDNVLFGDVWERPGLSKRDRSLITVAALVALYRPEQLRGHLERALSNGVTKDELSELITHLAEYLGPHKILWATDYPHPDGFFPGAPALIAEKLAEGDRRKVLAESAMQFYKL